ncbi:hypothetical protein FQB35_06740 [Crassaminicella thermophila]|uniref:Uncharacterized protein n=1 Tax=Crassaminicella thermophila TaxID=2599308 RepID=A0A5C0SBV2_CRATE|nr:hypothetical protein [Crassaminicella thermophila]QEK12095.1 hypothetical protein FQB35_06740 [Crassaminicella thermophila]
MEKSISHTNQSIHRKITEPAPYSTYDSHINIQTNIKQSKQDMTEPICILADKVYSYCQQRDCFPRFRMETSNKGEELQFIGINFQEGYISEGTLKVTPIGPKRPNFSRVKFILKIPFTIKLRNASSGDIVSMNGLLPDMIKDVVLFMPEARNEFNYRIVVETRSEVLAPPEIIDNHIEIPIGVLSVIRVVGRVHLLIPVYSLQLEPPEAENFEESEKSISQEFDNRPFPDDFFPPQFEDLDIGIQMLKKE